jgi:hypothetical protein
MHAWHAVPGALGTFSLFGSADPGLSIAAPG